MPIGLLTDLYGRNLRFTYNESDTARQVYTTIQSLIKIQNFDLMYKGIKIPRDLSPIAEYPGIDNYPICVVPENRARSLGFWMLPALSIRPGGGQKVTIKWSDGAIGQYQLTKKLDKFSGKELYPELENLGIFLKPGDISVEGRQIFDIGSIDQATMYSFSFDDYLLEVNEFTYSQALSGVAMTKVRPTKPKKVWVQHINESESFEDESSGSRTSSESTSDFEATLLESGSGSTSSSSESEEIVVPKITKPIPKDDSDSSESKSDDDDSDSDDDEAQDKIRIKVQGLNTLIKVYETDVYIGDNLTPKDVYQAVRSKTKVNDRQISFQGRRLSQDDTIKLKFNPITDIFRIEPNVVPSRRFNPAASSTR